MDSQSKYPLESLGRVLKQDVRYITKLEPRLYPKLSVRLYGRGAVLDTPADGASVLMSRHQLAEPGQVILSEIWAKKGAIGIVPPDGAGALITSHFFLFDIVDDLLDPSYLKWLLQGNYFERLLWVEARGTTGYAAIRPKQFLELEIPLPPLAEQHRIVARIDALAARVEEAKGLRAQAVAEVEAVTPQTVAQYLANTEWPRYKLRELLREDTKNGLAPSLKDSPPGIPTLRISAATARPDAVVEESDYKYLDVDDMAAGFYRLVPGDLLACRFNGNLHYVGRFALYTHYLEELRLFPDKLIRFRVDESRLLPEFARYALNGPSCRRDIEAMAATTAGNIGISGAKLKQLDVPLPPMSEQRRIMAELDNLHAKVDVVKRLQAETQAELDALLPAVLDRAFRGEL